MIRHGQLRDYFAGVGAKRLSAVDAVSAKSNQHEVGITQDMRDQFLGDVQQKQQFPTVYTRLDEDWDSMMINGTATYYDARERKADRSSEWRLYYSTNSVTDMMREGDMLFLALDRKGVLHFIVTPGTSTSKKQLSWLFGLTPNDESFVSKRFTEDGQELGFTAGKVLEKIGINLREPSDASRFDDVVGRIVEKCGGEYPRTEELSDIVRHNLPEVSPEDDPDDALVTWLQWEKVVFERLDKQIIGPRLLEGFVDKEGEPDVSGFDKYAKTVTNRRKSRMGYSLEGHVEAVFRSCNITYDRGKETENKHKPDFLFPDVKTYQAASTGYSCLTMLGVKSSCKDRWRQVLAEASKIPNKHLFTLESEITVPQTDQMKSENLQLVVPQSVREEYEDSQQSWLWNLAEFIQYVRDRSCRK